MSSGEDEQTSKRKKAHRPCDMCRKKKRRCDGEEPCSRCIKYGFTCTYEQKAVKRASTSYVQSLESRLKTVESLLQQQQQAPSILPLPTAPRPSDFQKAGPGVQIVIASIRAINSPFPAPHPDDASWNRVSDKLKHLKISGGFHGKSSPTNLVDKVIGAKDCGQTGEAQGVPKHAVSGRPWTIRPWTTIPPKKYVFPEDNLLVSLATLYFTHFNFYYPLLHRDTFERDLANGLHLKSETEFGATVLLVCALGAQYSTDPRVRSGIREAPPGNVWFDQVDLAGSAQPSLYTLQSYCLATLYLEHTSGARACWTVVGTGIRLAQEIGAHPYWVLTQLNTQFSAALGRSIAIPTQDSGWMVHSPNHPISRRPSTFFVLQLKLYKILSYTLKILYATSRIQRLIGLNDDHWIDLPVVEFDSALNGWFESIPSHLPWNPNKSAASSEEDPTIIDQAAVLH
ncbi:Zn(2)-C6 fungal-type domain-containing protein [Mycena chlorophos]|uniref:Zn(2)-C6 fungal-type domain-containing protein n=1 Tax=Mycena chlorophos TaxID=658473 RepID=A0A8H6RZ35_MYCCL|nr:Zn(2)-C6 fungal-type domain-containing protein [Mycena chlorophos]